MNQDEIKDAIKDAITAYATDNTARAEQVLHEVLQAKMRDLMSEAKLTEADQSNFSSGFARSSKAKLLLRSFTRGDISIDFPGSSWVYVNHVDADRLEQGKMYLAHYDSTNQGTIVFKFLGVGYDDTDKPVSIKNMMQEKKVKYLDEIPFDSDSNDNLSLHVDELDENGKFDKNNYYYLYDGNWVVGGGAEPLEFYEIKKVDEPIGKSAKTKIIMSLKAATDSLNDRKNTPNKKDPSDR